MKLAAVLIAIVLSAAAGVGAGWWHWHHSATTVGASLRCAHTSFGVDGTGGPLFCRAPDPAMLAYYRKLYPQLFSLGPNVPPVQVANVLKQETKTLPMDCQAYTLAQSINGWSFGYNPVDLNFPSVPSAC